MSYIRNVIIDTNNATGDAFGRLRVSEPTTLFDSKQIFDSQPLLWDDQETSGSGTGSSHSTNTASTTMTVGTAAGTRVRQTFQSFNYQPGKSQLILLTGVIDKSGGGAGIIRRVGQFDANNGLFFEDNEGTLRVVRRTSTSGSPVDNAVAQSSWNIDPMDGTGPSGVTIDISKTNICVIQYEWLGVGAATFGFNIDGVTYPCHQFRNANNLTVVYMSTPNLPLRYEISNDGTGSASSLEHICASVMSEGGTQDLGQVRYASTGGTHVDLTSENTVYALIGIRLKSAYIGSAVKILNASIQLHTASHQCEWTIRLNPTVAGTFTYSDQTNSAVQIATGATANTVTGGTIISGGHIESSGATGGKAGSEESELVNALRLGANIAGTVDTIVVCLMPIAGSSNVDAEAGITWQELS